MAPAEEPPMFALGEPRSTHRARPPSAAAALPAAQHRCRLAKATPAVSIYLPSCPRSRLNRESRPEP